MQSPLALLYGTLFGFGLAVSGLADPARVLGFLDVAGAWDPRLAFVMAGALLVTGLGYTAARRRERSGRGVPLALPTRQDIDFDLIAGATVFGIGWGLIGLCPGPALANLHRGSFEVVLFVGAMLVGVVGYRLPGRPSLRRTRARSEGASAAT